MKTIKIDQNGDILIENNSFVVVNAQDEFNQYIKTLLSIRKGEWFLDINLGLSHENILSKNLDKSKIEFDVIETLRQDSRVDKINIININFDIKKRIVNIVYEITTTENEVVEGQVDI